jgi:predicted MFS family arabinose efflux permease
MGAIGTPVLLALIGGADRKVVLSLSALVFAAGALAMGLVPGLILIIVARLVVAAGAGVYTSMGQATAMAMASPERRGRAVTTMLIGTGAAVALGVPVGAWIAGVWSWRATYLLIAVLGVASAGMLWLLLPKGMTAVARTLRERISVVTLPGVRPLLATTACFMLGAFMVSVYIAPLTAETTGLGKAILPMVLFAYGLGAVVANVAGGRVLDRFGGYRTAVYAGISQAVFLVLIPLAVYAPAPILVGIYCALIFAFSLSGWTFHAAQITRIASLASEQAPLAISLNGTAINIGSGLAAIAGGIVLERLGVGLLPWMAAVPSLAAVGIITLIRPEPVAVTI